MRFLSLPPSINVSEKLQIRLNRTAYNYKIEYRTGADNGNADALSRKPLVQTNLDALKPIAPTIMY